MALSIDESERDAFQAALTFVEEYGDLEGDDSEPLPLDVLLESESESVDHSNGNDSNAMVTSAPNDCKLPGEWDDMCGLLQLDELTPDDIVDIASFSDDSAGGDGSGAALVPSAGAIAAGRVVAQIAKPRHPQHTNAQTHMAKTAATTKKDLVVKKKKAPSAKKKNNSKYNPNRARDERREELIYLRKKVSELETQLQAIRFKRPQLAVGSVGEQQNQYGTMVVHQQQQQIQQYAVIPGVWQDVASHQCEERLKSERENIRLKLVLENQIKIAKTLEKFLHKTTSTKEVEKCVGGNRLHHMYPPTVERTDAEIFEDLLAGADKAYAEVDAVFESNGLAHIETTHSDARMRSDGAKGMCLEMFANKVLPFDMHSTGTAAWHHFVFAKQRTPSRFYNYNSPKNADATEDTIVENFTLGLHANSTSLHMSVKQVLRRYIDENRVVVIWRSMFDPVEFSDEPLSGVRFHETGYIVVQRPSTASDNYSLVKTCYIFTPNFSGDAKSGIQHKVGAITDFMLSATAANITSTHQMIENVLLEQAMRKSGHI